MPATKIEIYEHLIDFFTVIFPAIPRGAYHPGFDIRGTFRFPPQAWADVADRISDQSWMRRLGIRLQQSDMARIPRLGQMTEFIWALYNARPHANLAIDGLLPRDSLSQVLAARRLGRVQGRYNRRRHLNIVIKGVGDRL